MHRILGPFLLLAVLLAAPSGATREAPSPGGGVLVLAVDGVIGPATSQFIRDGLARAAGANAALVVIELDTPGGLDTAMREIIKAILASPVPVATYVHPEGARAASAGTYILYASHLAAMSPATNLGAATPVAIGLAPPGPAPAGEAGKPGGGAEADKAGPGAGDPIASKAVNDATAYLKSLAGLRGRNLEFAERAVREAASLPAEEALEAGVIDVLAADLGDLLAQLDGRELKLLDRVVTLRTANAAVERFEADWRTRLLATLANPQLALVLMMIGIYGLFFEFTSPGFGVPGVAGAICLLLALYAFHLLPVNWAGVALLALGAALMLAEAFLPSFGVLGVGGIVAFVLGGLLLIDAGMPMLGVPTGFLLGLAALSGLILFAIGAFAVRSRSRPQVSGSSALAGATGTVTCVEGGEAWASVNGEAWRVRGRVPLAAGQMVRVRHADGLTLEVEPLADHTERGRT